MAEQKDLAANDQRGGRDNPGANNRIGRSVTVVDKDEILYTNTTNEIQYTNTKNEILYTNSKNEMLYTNTDRGSAHYFCSFLKTEVNTFVFLFNLPYFFFHLS